MKKKAGAWIVAIVGVIVDVIIIYIADKFFSSRCSGWGCLGVPGEVVITMNIVGIFTTIYLMLSCDKVFLKYIMIDMILFVTIGYFYVLIFVLSILIFVLSKIFPFITAIIMCVINNNKTYIKWNIKEIIKFIIVFSMLVTEILLIVD